MSRVGILSRSSTHFSGVTFTGTGSMAATGRIKASAAATFTGVGSIAATGTVKAFSVATFTGVGTLVITLPVPLVVVRPSALELLLLETISRRQETVRFDLLDASNAKIGELAVDRDNPPDVSNDGNRRIRRQLSGVAISPADINAIDTLNERVQPWWVLGEGGPGYEFPLGIFLFADASSLIRTFGVTVHATLHDQCLILDQPLLKDVGYPTGQNVQAALEEQAGLAGIVGVSIDATDATIGEPIALAAGRDSRLKVLESLCLLAGFLPPYFDNNGALICRAHPDLSVATTSLVYGPGGRVVDASIVASDDLLSAPNVYLALDTGATELPILGTFTIPDDAPHSIANRGFAIPKLVEIQGLADQAAADAAAEAAYATDSATFTWLSFDSTPDPRHDTFDVIEFDEVLYREQSWRLPCAAGAAMNHDARGIYQETP